MGKRGRQALLCCVCFVRSRYNLGRCHSCLRGLSPELRKKLQAMTRAQRTAEFEKTMDHPRPRWAYENEEGEAELAAQIEMTERQELEKQNDRVPQK